jgi:hypothetical protein
MEYTFKKRITDKYAEKTLVVEEWIDGNQRYQRVELLPKGAKSGMNKGLVLAYGISPKEQKCYNLQSIIKGNSHTIWE